MKYQSLNYELHSEHDELDFSSLSVGKSDLLTKSSLKTLVALSNRQIDDSAASFVDN